MKISFFFDQLLVTCRTQNQIQLVYIDASNSHYACTTVLGSFCAVNRRIQPSTRSRFEDTADYIKRRSRTKFGERCFSHADPAASNSSPDSIKLYTDKIYFKTRLFLLHSDILVPPLDNLYAVLYKFLLVIGPNLRRLWRTITPVNYPNETLIEASPL